MRKNKTVEGRGRNKMTDKRKKLDLQGNERKRGEERDAHIKVDALVCFSIWMHPTEQLLD